MARLQWDKVGERLYETGVDRGVLFIPNAQGVYNEGYAWNGLTTVTESPTGAESTPLYADNIKYVNLVSAEEFGATIEAFTYPDKFGQCDGTAAPQPGVLLGQQRRRTFGLAYRSRLGNDLAGADYGYKLHLIYGATAAPSEKAYATINDSPEAITFSWELMTTPVEVGVIASVEYKPTASITIDSTKVTPAALTALEDIIYGTAGADSRLPLPTEVISMFAVTLVSVETQPPTYNATTDVVTIPVVTGVIYSRADGVAIVGGTFTITADTVVLARPAAGFRFTPESDTDWSINFA